MTNETLIVDGIEYPEMATQGSGKVLATVNGHKIRAWYSAIGRIYTVGDTDIASATFEGAQSAAMNV